MKKYQVLISQKYLRSRVVNIIAVVAVMLGVAALIIVSSVMDGFAHDIQARIRGIMSHVVVESDQLVGIGDYERLMSRIEKAPQVKACAPLVESPFVLIRSGKQTRFGKLRGIDLEREKETTEIETYLKRLRDDVKEYEEERERVGPLPPGPQRTRAQRQKEYEYRVSRGLMKKQLSFGYDDATQPRNPGALVGIALATGLGLYPGGTLSITSPTTILTFQAKDVDIVGGFRCGHYEYDSQLIYVPLRAAQDLLGLPGRVTSISVRLHDIRQVDEAKKEIGMAIRNRTLLIDPADEREAGRLEKTFGNAATIKDGDKSWIRVIPEGDGRANRARIVIKDLGSVLERADGPTTLWCDLRLPGAAEPAAAPWFEIALVDSAGRRYYHDADLRQVYISVEARGKTFAFSHGLANFVSADGLDLLDPADIEQMQIEVHNAPVEFANIRFEDNRPVKVYSWHDKQRSLLRAVDVERYIQVIIMSLMVVIAGFSILAILWLMVREKTRDIGILMSLGATRGGIVRIFLMNGLMIGFVGAALGLTVGWVISAKLNVIEDAIYHWTGWRAFPPDIYYLDKLPHQESPLQFCTMALVAMAVSLAAALWPAIQASRLDPVEALRYE